MERIPIFESSPEMKAPKRPGRDGKYPWLQLKIGQSFPVGKVDIAKSSLQTLAYRHGKRHFRKYRIIERADHYEVGLVAILNNTGTFSTAPGSDIVRIENSATGNAPLGWPVIKKEGE